jgi:hypothetical protein
VKAWRELSPLGRCYAVTAVVWVGGWLVSLLIYCLAAPVEADPLSDYKHSKTYLYNVQKFAGGAAVFGNEVSDWFSSLWKGPTLGLTLGVLTAVIALAYFVLTSRRIRRLAKRS